MMCARGVAAIESRIGTVSTRAIIFDYVTRGGQKTTRLVPAPRPLKKAFLGILDGTGLGRVPLCVPLGNLYMFAQKP